MKPNQLKRLTEAVRKAEAELAAARTRSTLTVAARKLMRAKAELKRLQAQAAGATRRASFGLVAVGTAAALFAAPAEAATEVVAGVISCTSTAPRTATFNGSNGIIEGDLVCSSRPSGGDCTEQIRQDIEARGCALRRDNADGEEILYFVCSGPRADMIELIDLICRRLNGF